MCDIEERKWYKESHTLVGISRSALLHWLEFASLQGQRLVSPELRDDMRCDLSSTIFALAPFYLDPKYSIDVLAAALRCSNNVPQPRDYTISIAQLYQAFLPTVLR
jgi:hypothetical protein